MKNTYGVSISVTLFGESHGEAIGAVLDGLAPGIKIDYGFIDSQLSRRRPSGKTDTARRERDEYSIVSGVFNGYTTGTPIAIIIPNGDTKSKDYSKIKDTPRPSHADYTARVKYGGYEDYRGGGHFSGRITAPLVVAGAICMMALDNLHIKIGTHILKCGGVYDRPFKNHYKDICTLEKKNFPVLSDVENEMTEKILEAKRDGDSLGGILQTAIYGVPAGVGEPWFDTVEGMLSHALFSIGGIKGVEFGSGFAMADMRGSAANDSFTYEDGKIVTKTNNNGGINGGITNGMPIIFNCAVKPTPSISLEQETVNLEKGENERIAIEGRHDPAIVRRACVVVDSVSAICIADLLAQKYGTDVFTKSKKGLEYGVIGEVLKHSFSKEIHEEIGGYRYDVCEIPENELEDFFKKADFKGINVTIPYKEKVIPYLDFVSEDAKRIGAVNTVVNKDGKLYGYNTDYMGMKDLILRNGIDVKGKKVLILGNGGTAKTGYFVLSDLGAKEIIRVDRKKGGADATYEELVSLHSDAEFILNTTPVGMYPKNEGKIVEVKNFPRLEGLIDVVYNPLRTNITLEARKMGIPSESGLYMLVSQAVYALEIFTGKKYPKELCDGVFKDTLKSKENIVLIGMPGSGKTTVGKYLARLTGRELIDTDEEIENDTGSSVASIIECEGEPNFRILESEIIKEVSKKNGVIISTGGGCILRSENINRLRQNGRIYFIDRSLYLLKPTESRPLTSDMESMKRKFKERYELYKSSADFEIDGNGTVAQVANEILEEFNK